MAHGLGAGDVQAHQLVRRSVFAPLQRGAADEIVGFAFERNREANAGFKWIGLVRELVARKNEPGLDAHHIQPVQTHRDQSMRLPGRRDRIEHGAGVARVAPDLVAQLAGVTGARDHDRRATGVTQTAHGEAEPLQLGQRRLVWRRPDDGRKQGAAGRALHRDVVQLVRGIAHQHLQAQRFGLVLQPDTAEVVTADPAEVVAPQAQQGSVIEHAAMRVAQGGVHDLADAEFFHIACEAMLQQGFGVRPGDFEFAQRRQIDQHGLFAAGPVFGNRVALSVAARQPETFVFDEVTGQRRGAGMECGLSAHGGLRCGRNPVRNAGGKSVGRVKHAHQNIRGVPTVGRAGVIRAGRGHANQISQRAQQYIVARARPGFV